MKWWKRHYRRVVAAGLGTAAVTVVAAVVFVLLPLDPSPYLHPQGSGQILDRSGRTLYAFLNPDEQWCFPVELDAISPRLVQATIAAEDQRFRRHPGVDATAVFRAVWQNIRGVDVVSGASTLTMQVVKQRDRSSRSVAGKIYQALQALRLERHTSKDEILRAYLNTAPYGQNLIGCEAASRRYFGKTARELTLAEAALLAGLPKAPTAYMPLEHKERAMSRRNYVLLRMKEEGYVTAAEYDRSVKANLGATRHEYPALAPHLAMRMRPRLAAGRSVRTTLDAAIQTEVEKLLGRNIGAVRRDIGNAAAVVVDVESGEILARVGSASFYDTPGGGQVDACRAPRSPGSALKPFTYALAMERGKLYSSEMLLDYRLDFGRFNPENFDERFRGLVTASDALKNSLNIPAVTVLQRMGAASIQEFLRKGGLTTLNKPADFYGLGLTLGNCEVRLEELTGAYAMLANLGEYRPLRILADREPAEPKRLLARGTCLELFDMLEQPLPSELGGGAVPAAGVKPRLCWKTGTSAGYRDAWAFVFNRQYLVGVWMGNNDGRASRKLFGAWTALPLAGRIFRALPPKTTPSWPEAGDDLNTATVCAVSGLPASKWCFQTRAERFPRTQFLNRVCDMHYPAPGSRDAEDARVLERWPGSAKGWDLARIDVPTGPRGGGSRREQALRILSPAEDAEYVVTGEKAGDRIQLSSSMDAQSPLHWYMNDLFLGTSQPNDPLYLELSPGKHTLTCMTDTGTLDTVHFEVVTPEPLPRFEQN